MVFPVPPSFWGDGNSGAQAILSAHAPINTDGMRMKLGGDTVLHAFQKLSNTCMNINC